MCYEFLVFYDGIFENLHSNTNSFDMTVEIQQMGYLASLVSIQLVLLDFNGEKCEVDNERCESVWATFPKLIFY